MRTRHPPARRDLSHRPRRRDRRPRRAMLRLPISRDPPSRLTERRLEPRLELSRKRPARARRRRRHSSIQLHRQPQTPCLPHHRHPSHPTSDTSNHPVIPPSPDLARVLEGRRARRGSRAFGGIAHDLNGQESYWARRASRASQRANVVLRDGVHDGWSSIVLRICPVSIGGLTTPPHEAPHTDHTRRRSAWRRAGSRHSMSATFSRSRVICSCWASTRARSVGTSSRA